MRVIYVPEDIEFWVYSLHDDTVEQHGGDLAAFVGYPYQRGAGIGSFFRSLFRMAVPVLKNVAKAVGKQALITGANIASEALQTGELLPALEKHGKEGLGKLLKTGATALETGNIQQEGSGNLGKRKRSPTTAKVVKKTIKGRRRKKQTKKPTDIFDIKNGSC